MIFIRIMLKILYNIIIDKKLVKIFWIILIFFFNLYLLVLDMVNILLGLGVKVVKSVKVKNVVKFII